MQIDFEEKVRKAIAKPEHLRNMRRAFGLVVEKQAERLHLVPDLEARKSRLRATRLQSLQDGDLYETALDRLCENGFKVRFAADAEEAVSIVAEELGDTKLLVKSKTNISKEIGLTHRLEESGIEVVETDIGDRIVQLYGGDAVHPTGPSAHLSRYEIADLLSEKLNEKIEPDPYLLIEAVERDIQDAIARASIGLTGVNAIAAFEGAAVLINNEFNIESVSMLPAKHIMLAAVDKIYPNLEESLNMVKLQTFFATGEQLTSSVRIVSGPSKTADIEKKLFRGIQGPVEMVIVFVDNGRSGVLSDDGYRELLTCIGCGACLLECPAYSLVGPVFGMTGRLGGQGVSLSGKFGGVQEAIDNGLQLCTTCGACTARCPVEIKIGRSIEKTRSACVESGLLTPEHMVVLDNMKKDQNIFGKPRSERGNWAEGMEIKDINSSGAEVLFHAGCRFAYDADLRDWVRAAAGLLQAAGVDFAIAGAEECCCGGRAYKLGYTAEAEHYAEDLLQKIKASGASKLVTPCADCYACFKFLYPQIGQELPVEVMHTTGYLARLVEEGRLKFKKVAPIKVAYHDPCNLGRVGERFMLDDELAVDAPDGYRPARLLITAIPGVELLEMDRSRENSWCCGAGGGVMETYPGLCAWIASERLKEAHETGAEVLVTACPWCERAFLDATGDEPEAIEILDINGLLLGAVESRS